MVLLRNDLNKYSYSFSVAEFCEDQYIFISVKLAWKWSLLSILFACGVDQFGIYNSFLENFFDLINDKFFIDLIQRTTFSEKANTHSPFNNAHHGYCRHSWRWSTISNPRAKKWKSLAGGGGFRNNLRSVYFFDWGHCFMLIILFFDQNFRRFFNSRCPDAWLLGAIFLARINQRVFKVFIFLFKIFEFIF